MLDLLWAANKDRYVGTGILQKPSTTSFENHETNTASSTSGYHNIGKTKKIMKMWRVLDNFLTNNIVHNTLFVEELATVDGNK